MDEYQKHFKVNINSYFKSLHRKKIPKFVSIFYLAVAFGFGFDFGFLKVINEKYRVYLRHLSHIMSFLLVSYQLIISIFETDALKLSFDCAVALQYAIYVSLLYMAKYNVYDFIMNIYKIHNRMYDEEYKFLSCVLAYYLITFVLKMNICVAQCLQMKDFCFVNSIGLPRYAHCGPIFALDVVAVAQIFVYYYVYASLKFLGKLMENENLDHTNVRKQFMMIADCCDRISALYGKLVSIQHFKVRALTPCFTYLACAMWSQF